MLDNIWAGKHFWYKCQYHAIVLYQIRNIFYYKTFFPFNKRSQSCQTVSLTQEFCAANSLKCIRNFFSLNQELFKSKKQVHNILTWCQLWVLESLRLSAIGGSFPSPRQDPILQQLFRTHPEEIISNTPFPSSPFPSSLLPPSAASLLPPFP